MQYVLDDLVSAHINDLIDYLCEMYGLSVQKEQLIELSMNSAMFYDKIEQIMYADYDIYKDRRTL